MNILLVEPNFPIPAKSKNHKNFLPIGLLKIASYLKNKEIEVKLIRGTPKNSLELSEISNFSPSEILVTSLFTYWAKYVKDAVQYYKSIFPQSKIIVGGIYASLSSKKQVKEYTGCDEVYQGVMLEAEKYPPAYDLIENANPQPIDYQIIHASRGCINRCPFCGTYKIEPDFIPKESIKDEIKFKKIIFYDNNFFMNPYVENILQELIELKREKKIVWCESQSGFDGRVLLEKPYLSKMIKKAGFRYPRIAWDWEYNKYFDIKKQVDILIGGGYKSKDIFVFMLYNWNLPFEEMEKKRLKCWDWRVQIADCRYRPLDQTFDRYNPRIIGQDNKDYYIHENTGWTDALIKQFRKNIRRQNICVRQDLPFYSKYFEYKQNNEVMKIVKELKSILKKIDYLKNNNISFWIPDKITYPKLEEQIVLKI